MIEWLVFVCECLMWVLDNLDVDGNLLGEVYDVLFYLVIIGFVGNLGGNLFVGSNNCLSLFLLFLVLVMLVGMVDDLDLVMLVGMEMLGCEFDEEMLIKLVYVYQEQFQLWVVLIFILEL